ncbi:MAG: ABC transporter permease [Methanomicrobia archaeon]|nr:ABC transporter permease [Methanomicrobia archaeon]
MFEDVESFYAMCKKQLIYMARYPINFITSFAIVFIIILMVILATTLFIGKEETNYSFNAIAIYGMILFMFLSDTLWTIGYNIRWEQVQGTLEALYLTPASKFASLISRVTISIVWTGLNCIAAVIFVYYVFGALPFKNLIFSTIVLILTLSGTFGFGFCFAAFTLYLKESANLAANVLQFVFMILCAMFFPFSVLPDSVLKISKLIPLSYGVDLFRSSLMGYPEGFPELLPVNQEFLIILLFGIITPALGYLLYRKAEKKVRTDGSLGMY